MEDRLIKHLQNPIVFLHPPNGPAVVLTNNENWLGRNSVDLSKKALLLCSRKQACLKITDAAVTLESHGLNPLYFVVCHSANFQTVADSPPSSLHQLRAGQSVELVDGDKFFLVPRECLLTVRIKSCKSDGRKITAPTAVQLTPDSTRVFTNNEGTAALQLPPDGTSVKTNNEATAAVQLTPDGAHFNTQDDVAIPEQVCSPQATQMGLAVTNPPLVASGDLPRSEVVNNLSPQQENVRADSSLEAVPIPSIPPLNSVSSGLRISTDVGAELPPRQTEIAEMSRSENEGNALTQIESHGLEAEQAVRRSCGTGPIEGMQNVVVSISGYDDLLRARLINLIAVTGASYTGSLTKGNSHLVCWTFRGAKYEMAKKLGKIIVNHSWFEECLFAGRRLCEEGYKTSGEMTVPLRWDPSYSSTQHHSLPAGFDRDHAPTRSALYSPSGGELGPRETDSMLNTREFPLDSISIPLRGPGKVWNSRRRGGDSGILAHDQRRARLGRTLTTSGGSPVIDLTASPEQERASDDWFWDEVMREYEDRNDHVAEQSRPVVPKAHHQEGLLERTATGRRGATASATAGLSLRERAPVSECVESRSGGRRAHPTEAETSGFEEPSWCAQGERLQVGGPSSAGEQSGNGQSEIGPSNNDPVIFRHKRKQSVPIALGNFERAECPRPPTPADPPTSGFSWREQACPSGNLEIRSVGANALPNEAEPSHGERLLETWASLAGEVSGNAQREIQSGRRHDGADEAGPSGFALGERHEGTHEAGTSGVVLGERFQEQMASSAAGEGSGNVQTEVPVIIRHKRQQGLPTGGVSYKRAKCITTRLPAPGDPARQIYSSCVMHVRVEGPPTVSSGAAQERASTSTSTAALDTDADRQKDPNLTDSEAIGKTGDTGGTSASGVEITCVICYSDTKPTTEGVLACGHQFCFPCIHRWADETKSKSPSCPLCKVPFDFITLRTMDTAAANGSRAVLEETVVQIGHPELASCPSVAPSRTEDLCVTCASRDCPELLLVCVHCEARAIHTFCLDPPRPPGSSWFCSRCSPMHSRMQTREAYDRLFPRGPVSSSQQQESDAEVVRRPVPYQRFGGRPVPSHRQRQSRPEVPGSVLPQSTSRVEGSLVGLAGGEASVPPPQRNPPPPTDPPTQRDRRPYRRQNSMYRFLIRQNDVTERS